MRLIHPTLGTCDLEIEIEPSSVDSFVKKGFSETLERDLTDDELDEIQESYGGEISAYSYENGSINHN